MYSGDIDLKKGLVAAGTVFRVLIVWRLENGQILHKLKGHTGVIFDTLFLESGNSQSESDICIGSVSDDRTVRIWRNENQVAEMYGHTSRIWKLAQLSSRKSGS